MKNFKHLNLYISLFWILCLSLASATNKRNTTSSSTGESITNSPAVLNHINIINTTTVTIYTFLYDMATIPTNTTVPTWTFQTPCECQNYDNQLLPTNQPMIQNFTRGVQIRTITSPTYTSTASPATSPIIEFQYY